MNVQNDVELVGVSDLIEDKVVWRHFMNAPWSAVGTDTLWPVMCDPSTLDHADRRGEPLPGQRMCPDCWRIFKSGGWTNRD